MIPPIIESHTSGTCSSTNWRWSFGTEAKCVFEFLGEQIYELNFYWYYPLFSPFQCINEFEFSVCNQKFIIEKNIKQSDYVVEVYYRIAYVSGKEMKSMKQSTSELRTSQIINWGSLDFKEDLHLDPFFQLTRQSKIAPFIINDIKSPSSVVRKVISGNGESGRKGKKGLEGSQGKNGSNGSNGQVGGSGEKVNLLLFVYGIQKQI